MIVLAQKAVNGYTVFLSATPVLEFSGGSDTIALAESLVFPADAPFTVEYWLLSNNKPESKAASEYSIIWSSDGATYGIRHYPYNWVQRNDDSDTSRHYGTLNSGLLFTSPLDFYFNRNLDNGKWIHIAITRDSSNQILIYVDGNLIGDGSWSVAGGVWSGELRFNRIGNSHDGSVADVRVWDYERNREEIEFDRYRRLAGNEEGLLGYWPLDDDSGTTARDLTPAGNDGTISGALWQTDPALVLVADDSAFAPSTPITIADKVTGSEKFTNSDEVRVVSFPVPPAVDQYQVTFSPDPDSLDQTPTAWSSTAVALQELTFAQPTSDDDVVFYVWFRDELSPESLRRASAQIRYSTAAPVAVAHSSLARETAGYTVRIIPAELDNGSNGGTSDGTDIPIYKMELISVSNPVADLTPDEDFRTLPATAGNYSFALRVINAAGNESISAPCTVNLAETTLPSGDHYVAIGNLNADPPYATWATAAAEIQAAVNAAADNAKVLVARGTYQGSGAQIVNITRPLQLVGAHPREEVILDGGGGAFGNRRGIVATMPVPGTAVPEMLIANFTVRNCLVQEVKYGGSGVGIRLLYANAPSGSITVRNCVISGNRNVGSNMGAPNAAGAGIGADGANGSEFQVIVTDCLIQGNKTYGYIGDGAGVYFRYGKCTLEHSTISDNEVYGLRWQRNNQAYYAYVSFGSGVGFNSVSAGTKVNYCEFFNNGGPSVYRGNSIYVKKSPIQVVNTICRANTGVGTIFFDTPDETNLVRNCLVFDNTSTTWSGIALETKSHAIVESSTIVNNTCGAKDGGGAGLTSFYDTTSLRVRNSIVYDNSPNNFYPATRVLFEYSCTSPDAPGDGNINKNHLFVNASGKDFRLASTSPCRDAGGNQDWMIGAKDLDGKRRVDKGSGIVDMGCYEYLSSGTTLMLR